jgi:predicted nucleic acid-binding protein
MVDRYLPDTNILSAYLKQDRAVRLRLPEVDYFLSIIVLGELYRWAFLSRSSEPLETVRGLAEITQIVPVDHSVTERYGRITADAVMSGASVSSNDFWIAAQALRYDLTIVTRDGDFGRIPGLKLVRW